MRREYLADTSVWNRWGKPVVADRVTEDADAGLIYSCTTVDIEVGRSARSPEEHTQILVDRAVPYPWVVTPDDAIEQARRIHDQLALKGHHRKPGIPDLLIAVTGRAHGLTILHYDGDFERIAEVTGQPVEWVVPRGTAD